MLGVRHQQARQRLPVFRQNQHSSEKLLRLFLSTLRRIGRKRLLQLSQFAKKTEAFHNAPDHGLQVRVLILAQKRPEIANVVIEDAAADGETLPAPRSFAEIAKEPEVVAALKEGAALAIVPLLIESGRSVKANLSLDAWLLAAIDEAAAAHGLTRSAFLSCAARERSLGKGSKIRVFANEASLLRLASAILVEIDEQWAASQLPYVNFNNAGAGAD